MGSYLSSASILPTPGVGESYFQYFTNDSVSQFSCILINALDSVFEFAIICTIGGLWKSLGEERF